MAALVCSLIGGALVGGSGAAVASTDSTADVVADAVAEVAPIELEALAVEQSGGDLTADPVDGGQITAGRDPEAGLLVVGENGQSASIGLPMADDLRQGEVANDGSITYAGDRETPSLNVLVAEDAIRVSSVIESRNQGETFDYDFGPEARVELQEDGSALVVADAKVEGVDDATEVILADVDAPWAYDASGRSIDTFYEARGGILTQVVNHRGAATTYPVVADPTFDQPNVFQFRVRFNRAETATIAAGGWGGIVGSFSCGVMAPVCALASATIAYQAGVAQNSRPKRCVQVTATHPMVIPGLYWWVNTYSGGPCR